MQTFLPYADFDASARALDDRRLGKQRVEALQVLRALVRPAYGWKHHPAVRMWEGHEEAVAAYGLAICGEWVRRGYADSCAVKIVDELAGTDAGSPPRSQRELRAAGALPAWLGDEGFHLSHRSALLRKDPAFYAKCFGAVEDNLPYVWPII